MTLACDSKSAAAGSFASQVNRLKCHFVSAAGCAAHKARLCTADARRGNISAPGSSTPISAAPYANANFFFLLRHGATASFAPAPPLPQPFEPQVSNATCFQSAQNEHPPGLLWHSGQSGSVLTGMTTPFLKGSGVTTHGSLAGTKPDTSPR